MSTKMNLKVKINHKKSILSEGFKKTPYGIFKGSKITKKEIDEITSSLDKEIDEIVDGIYLRI